MKAPVVCVLIFGLLICQGLKFEEKSSVPKYANPDQYGYRFCASWKLADGTPIYSGCDPYVSERCGKELEFDYRCCAGFEPSNEHLGGDSHNPCGKIIPHFNDCPSVVESLGFPKFATYLRTIPELVTKSYHAHTIFVPLNQHDDEMKLIYEGNADAIKYSVVKGRYYADDLRCGMEPETLYYNQTLRIFRSACGVVNVDCVELSQADIECGSGLIHIVRRPLIPRQSPRITDKVSVMNLLLKNSETRAFAQSLPTVLQKELDSIQSGRVYTVTAPTSEAWQSISDKYSREDLEKIAANHVSVGYRCTSSISKSEQQLRTINDLSHLTQCFVNTKNAEVRRIIDVCGQAHEFITKYSDQVAANGVVHVLNGPIIPSSSLTLKDYIDRPECAKYQNIDKFMEILRGCDLHMSDTHQYAVIAPQNSAFDWWRDYRQFRTEYQRFQTDSEYRCKVARYHIVKHDGHLANITVFSGHTSGRRTNNQNDYLYETAYFRKEKMSSTLFWHYSPVNYFDTISLRGSSIYRTSRINVIPEKNITDILNDREDFSHTKKLTQIAQMEEKVFSKKAPTNLYLVTTNDGWIDPRSKLLGKNLMSSEYARYQSDPKLAENYALLNHVPLYLWGGDIGYFEKNSVHRFMSSAGVELIFWMDEQGVMRIGYDDLPQSSWPRVVEFNIPARDGIAWALDGILQCPPRLCPMVLEDIDVYSFFTSACITATLPGEKDPKKDFNSEPTEIAYRHPEKCLVIRQGEVTTVKDIFEDGPYISRGN